jgi:hypothetical protein
MPWFKVDDGFTTSRKVISMPRQHRMLAIGAWTMAGNFAAKELTDGYVPQYYLDEIGATDELVQTLIKADLWIADDKDGIWFKNWCEYQPSATAYREKQEARASKRSQDGKMAAAKRWHKDGNATPNGLPIGSAMGSDAPEPEPEPDNLRELPAAPISPDFSPDYDHAEWAKAEWPTVNWEAETAKFVNHFLSKGEKRRDWVAAWRNWIIIEGERSLKRAEVQRSKYPDGKF